MSVPMSPPAPPTFSRSRWFCSRVESCAASIRPTTSLLPPGGNGITRRMGLGRVRLRGGLRRPQRTAPSARHRRTRDPSQLSHRLILENAGWGGIILFAMAVRSVSKGQTVRQRVTREAWSVASILPRHIPHGCVRHDELSANHSDARAGARRAPSHQSVRRSTTNDASCSSGSIWPGASSSIRPIFDINKRVTHSQRHPRGAPGVDCVSTRTPSRHGGFGDEVRAAAPGANRDALRQGRIPRLRGVAIDAAEEEPGTRPGDHAGMILRNHGLLVWARAFPEAFYKSSSSSAPARCNGRAGLQRGAADAAAESSTRRTASTSRRRACLSALEWPALLRKLDKIDPSFRD